MPSIDQQIERFLAAPAFAVAGASTNRDKYGNRVLRCYLQKGRRVIPVHPREPAIEGVPCVPSVAALPADVKSLSIVTPPPVTEQVVEQAIARGVENVWMQPGAESPAAIARCEAAGVNVIGDGSCLLVVLGYHESWTPGGR
ncbi:MAG TPA: CoA-binding protein [Anaeromyxobacteraceae bacterium]|nr:CoA-binding protein [Anaeromyxobacteraceae bacterium]